MTAHICSNCYKNTQQEADWNAHGASVSHGSNDSAAGRDKGGGRIVADDAVDHGAQHATRIAAAAAAASRSNGMKQQATAAGPQPSDASLREECKCFGSAIAHLHFKHSETSCVQGLSTCRVWPEQSCIKPLMNTEVAAAAATLAASTVAVAALSGLCSNPSRSNVLVRREATGVCSGNGSGDDGDALVEKAAAAAAAAVAPW